LLSSLLILFIERPRETEEEGETQDNTRATTVRLIDDCEKLTPIWEKHLEKEFHA
jgi:hypothetical protein